MKFFIGIISITLLSLISCKTDVPAPLPKLGHYNVEKKNLNGRTSNDTIYPRIPIFHFLNEDSILVTNTNFKNKIWVVEFFFSICPTICPVMNSQMKKLVAETKPVQDQIQFLSFTIDPLNDTPSKLKLFRNKNQIKSSNWTFLTGDEATTHQLGIQNFLTFAGKDSESAGGYAHSGSFTLVDKAGYVRGVYAITDFGLKASKSEYKRLVTDINNLLKYEYHVD